MGPHKCKNVSLLQHEIVLMSKNKIVCMRKRLFSFNLWLFILFLVRYLQIYFKFCLRINLKQYQPTEGIIFLKEVTKLHNSWKFGGNFPRIKKCSKIE